MRISASTGTLLEGGPPASALATASAKSAAACAWPGPPGTKRRCAKAFFTPSHRHTAFTHSRAHRHRQTACHAYRAPDSARLLLLGLRSQ